MNIGGVRAVAGLKGDGKPTRLVEVETQRGGRLFFEAKLVEGFERTGRARFDLDRQDFFTCGYDIIHLGVFFFSFAKPVVQGGFAGVEEGEVLTDELLCQCSLVHEHLRSGLGEGFPATATLEVCDAHIHREELEGFRIFAGS